MSSKKSFIAYNNWQNTFDQLTDEEAGKLVRHIFAYVNGNIEQSEDKITRVAFSQIKDSIDRDLEKWEQQLEQRRDAGRKSGEVRKRTTVNENERPLTTVNETQRNRTDSVSVSDSVNESVSDINSNAPKFEDFWIAYDKKVGRDKVEKKWDKLSLGEKEEIMEHVPAYVASTPEKKYRKQPMTYLNGKHWQDEIINNTNGQQPQPVKKPDGTPAIWNWRDLPFKVNYESMEGLCNVVEEGDDWSTPRKWVMKHPTLGLMREDEMTDEQKKVSTRRIDAKKW